MFVCTTGKILCAKTCWVGGAVVVKAGWGGVLGFIKNQVFSNSRTTYAPYNFYQSIHLLAFFGGFFVGGGSHAVTLAPNNDLLLPWFI